MGTTISGRDLADLDQLVDELLKDFLTKARERGISTEYLCDTQRIRAENKVKESLERLLSPSK